ncbi:MAG: DUF4168 domain-containing protein [Balneolaceae bacterium]
MHFLKSIVTATVMIMVGSSLALAQVQTDQQQQQQQQPDIPAPDEISDDELAMFLDASDSIRPIQEEAEVEMEHVVEDEGMDFNRFQELMMGLQNPEMADQLDISSEEEEKIQVMQPKLMEIQMETEEKMVESIEEKGLNVQRYQSIFFSLQQHPELMERLETLIDERDEDEDEIEDEE